MGGREGRIVRGDREESEGEWEENRRERGKDSERR